MNGGGKAGVLGPGGFLGHAGAKDRAWPGAAALAVVVTGMVFSFWWLPVTHHSQSWALPGDLWVTFREAHIVAWGGEGILYQENNGFVTFPGIAVVLAPLAMISSALHLTESYPFVVPHPTAWLLLGPVSIALGTVLIFAVDAVARRLSVTPPRRLALSWLTAALVWQTVVIWGHPEDLIAVSLALYGLMAAFDGNWKRCALFCAAALTFQPFIIVLLPIAGMYVPRRKWGVAAGILLAPSAVLLAAPLVHAWRTTTHELIDQPTFPQVSHATPWAALAPVLGRSQSVTASLRYEGGAHGVVAVAGHAVDIVAGGPSRLFAVMGALVIAWLIARRRPGGQTVIWLAALALGLRCVFEAVILPYYLVPALALALVVAAASGRGRLAVTTACAAVCTCVSYWHLGPWQYYLPVTALLLGAWAMGWPGREREEAPGRGGSDVTVAGDLGGARAEVVPA